MRPCSTAPCARYREHHTCHDVAEGGTDEVDGAGPSGNDAGVVEASDGDGNNEVIEVVAITTLHQVGMRHRRVEKTVLAAQRRVGIINCGCIVAPHGSDDGSGNRAMGIYEFIASRVGDGGVDSVSISPRVSAVSGTPAGRRRHKLHYPRCRRARSVVVAGAVYAEQVS